MMRACVLCCSGLLVLAGSSGGVWAQEHPAMATTGEDGAAGSAAIDDDSDAEVAERPWSQGVAAEDKEAARRLFDEGNDLLADALFVKAASTYRQALTHWEHPAIFFNLALALMNMDQPVEVYQALEKAMEYGAEPLDRPKYRRAEEYQKVVEAQIAWIEVICNEPGAEVSVDGQPLFTAPGRREVLVRKGEHNIGATKDGYVPVNEAPTLAGGERFLSVIKLYTIEDLTRYERRWQLWKPWTTTTLGVLLVGTAGYLNWSAVTGFADYDRQIEECVVTTGQQCDPTPEQEELQERSNTQQNLAVAGYIAGGITLTAGMLLIYFNRLQPYRISAEQLEAEAMIAPILSPHMTGIQAVLRF